MKCSSIVWLHILHYIFSKKGQVACQKRLSILWLAALGGFWGWKNKSDTMYKYPSTIYFLQTFWQAILHLLYDKNAAVIHHNVFVFVFSSKLDFCQNILKLMLKLHLYYNRHKHCNFFCLHYWIFLDDLAIFWTILAIFWQFWQFWQFFDNFDNFLTIFWQFFDNFDNFLTILTNFWQFFWQFFVNFWQISDSFGTILTNFGKTLKIQCQSYFPLWAF